MKPKFKAGDSLIYVDPFVFILERVQLEFTDIDNGKLYWVDNEGAYLAEENLFVRLDDAKIHAQKLLENFYTRHTKIIQDYRII